MKVALCGVTGRMGKTILSVLLEKGHVLAHALDADSCPMLGQDAGAFIATKTGIAIQSLSSVSLAADVAVDFSTPSATEVLLQKAVASSIPVVIGTTGFSETQRIKIQKAAEFIPIVFSPNMSVGVNLLFKLTQIASSILQEGYDVEIFEAHHRLKKDSPSGTAKKLIDIVMENRKDLEQAKLIHGREGIVGERTNNEIGVMVLRGGDIVGEHTVYFVANGERIELTHRATSRENFARGAVKAAEFVVNKKPGLYTMFDVLGL